eukprot:13048054-Heterocapsa_arctica.AAC.1
MMTPNRRSRTTRWRQTSLRHLSLLRYYMPADRGLGHFTTTKSGEQRIDTLTTRELMEYRIIWDQGI